MHNIKHQSTLIYICIYIYTETTTRGLRTTNIIMSNIIATCNTLNLICIIADEKMDKLQCSIQFNCKYSCWLMSLYIQYNFPFRSKYHYSLPFERNRNSSIALIDLKTLYYLSDASTYCSVFLCTCGSWFVYADWYRFRTQFISSITYWIYLT